MENRAWRLNCGRTEARFIAASLLRGRWAKALRKR